MRCIDADALLTDLNNIKYPGAPYVDAGIRIAVGKICDAQTIEPERKKGKWKRHYCEDENPNGWRCDNCDEWYYFGQTLPNFCPNCGADMRGEQDD